MSDDQPFRILIAGDFSGRSHRPASQGPLTGRPAIQVDRDNFDEVLASLSPQLQVGPLSLRFSCLDDLHPDSFRRHLPSLPPAPPVPPSALLDDILEAAPQSTRPARADDAADLPAFIKRVTAPHLAPKPDPQAARRRSEADRATGALISAVLHHPRFQALESAWRALDLLVRKLDTDGGLKLYILDVSRQEVAADPEGFAALLAPPAVPWAVCACNFVFNRSAEDLALLAQLGRAGAAGRCSIIAEADPRDLDAGTPEWREFRHTPEASWLALSLPRFLLRLPYGSATSPLETLDYDEMPEPRHTHYLWANPAFACAYLLGASFLADGWHMRPGSQRQIDGLPIHVYSHAGETQMKPCAEILMPDAEAETLLDQGIMPLVSKRDEGAALLVRFQSLADPPTPLQGRWN